jgi:recombination protein RecA
MIETQKQGGIPIFMDHEQTFDSKLAERMGLDLSPNKFIYRKPKTWEESNTLAMQMAERIRSKSYIDDEAPILAVFDSVAAMIPQSVFEKGIDQYNMNDTTALARVTSTTLKAVNQYVGKFNMTALYLNQIRTKPGVMFGDPTGTPGGQAMEFFATIRISLSKKAIKDGDEFVGQIITAKTVKNKLTRPQQKVQWILKFNENDVAEFDAVASSLQYLKEKGMIDSSGAYYVWGGKKLHLGKLANLIRKNPEELEKMNALFKDTLDDEEKATA